MTVVCELDDLLSEKLRSMEESALVVPYGSCYWIYLKPGVTNASMVQSLVAKLPGVASASIKSCKLGVAKIQVVLKYPHTTVSVGADEFVRILQT